MKYLFLKEGWTAESFLAELQSRLDFKLLPGAPEQVPDDVFRDHAGIHPQRQPGLSYVGASVLRGRMTGEQLEPPPIWPSASAAARCAPPSRRTCSSSIFPTTRRRNWRANWPDRPAGRWLVFWRGAVACTGTEFCKLAITETKGFTRWLVDELEERLPEFDQQLKLHVTGCPNGCGQHWIADIGIEGKKIKHEGKLTDAYYFCLGGAVGQHASIARPVGYRCPATLVPEAIERLLRHYLATPQSLRRESARLVCRHSNDELRADLRARRWRRSSAICPRAACPTESPIEDQAMSLLPVFLKLDGRRGLAGGRGQRCARQDRQPAQDRVALRVVAPIARPEIRQLAEEASSNGFSGPLNSPTSMATSW
jgi:sulfite reductase (ferredoxin)